MCKKYSKNNNITICGLVETHFICKEKNRGCRDTFLLAVNQNGCTVTVDNESLAWKYNTKEAARKDIERIRNKTFPWQIIKYQTLIASRGKESGVSNRDY